MPESIFDLLDDDIKPGKEGFLDVASRAPMPNEKSFFNDIADYGKTIIKGGIEGLGRLGRIMGPLQDFPDITEEGEIIKPRSTEEQLEEQTKNLDVLLPTDEGAVQKGIRRGLRETPTALAFPGASTSTIGRSLAAGGAGQLAEELGAPEWVQTAAEFTAFMGPDLTKKLISSGSNKEIIKEARKMGLTDEEITPLIQSDFKQKWLSKITPKRGATERVLGKTKESLGTAYKNLSKLPGAKNEISELNNGKLINSLKEKIALMPRKVQAKVNKDFQDLLGNKITGESLMNFYSDVNHSLGGKTKQLSLLKGPIKDAIKTLSPDLAKDFDTVNLLYSKYSKIAGKLKPSLTSDIVSGVETLAAGGALASAVMGNPYFLGPIATKISFGKLSQQMLTNPRLQQITTKLVQGINQNKWYIVKNLLGLYAREIKNDSPEMYDQLKSISEEDLKELFSQKEAGK